MAWFETLPLTAFAVVVLATLLTAAAIGYRGHLWLQNRRGETASESHEHLLSAVLGLLALLLGFTFSLALDRYEARRELVVREANALDAAWLRAQLLEPPNRTEMSNLLRAYLDVRLAWSEADTEADPLARTVALRRALWAATGKAIRSDPNPALSRALLDSMNESFDLAAARRAARRAHVPDRVFTVLLIYALLSAAMLGYSSAAKRKPQRIATVSVMVLLTLALVVILDVDRPRSGAIQVSQLPLEELKGSWQ